MTLHPFLPVGIQDLDNNFAHFLDELLLVFLLDVAASVGCCLRGPSLGLARGGDAGLGGGEQERIRHGDVALRQRDVNGEVHLVLATEVPRFILALRLLQRPPLLPLDPVQAESLLPSLPLLLLAFLCGGRTLVSNNVSHKYQHFPKLKVHQKVHDIFSGNISKFTLKCSKFYQSTNLLELLLSDLILVQESFPHLLESHQVEFVLV